MIADAGLAMATLATPITSAEEWSNPNKVKVVCDARGDALYFSRSPIPFARDSERHPAECAAAYRRLRLPARFPAEIRVAGSRACSNRSSGSNNYARSSTAIGFAWWPRWRRRSKSIRRKISRGQRAGALSLKHNLGRGKADGTRQNQIHFRQRRRRFIAGQGPRRGLAGRPARSARPARHDAQDGPVYQHRSGHDESVAAWRGLRHRRRRRNRSRPRPLRAFCANADEPPQQLHDRANLRYASSRRSATAIISARPCR